MAEAMLQLGSMNFSEKGLRLKRKFTKENVHPYDEISWEKRDAIIKNERGEIVFEQRGVEIPAEWSQNSTNIVVSKYFRGKLGAPERETSARQMIDRVVKTIGSWGRAGGYFANEESAKIFEDELVYMLVNQMFSFNSPVWFNVGVDASPQTSACFILDIKDTMQDILRWYATEGMIFKFGSGSGINISPLRGSKEFLAGGGNSSGPVAYMKAADVSAGTIKSGGKTRRAAKMVILNAEHPDIVEFINCKASEEKKAWALIDAGYDVGFNVPGGAYDSVFFQNANHSVRATDEFMKAVERDDSWQTKFVKSGAPAETYKAREILKMIAEAVWVCGDPGMQFDSNVNMWHTCKASGRINGSNPCVTGDSLISTSEGYKRIRDLVGGAVTIIDGVGRESLVTNVFPTGQKEIYELKTKSGFNLKLTADHKIFTANRGDVALKDLTEKDFVMLQTPGFGSEQIPIEMAEVLGAAIGDGCIAVGRKEQRMLFITLAPEESAIAERLNSVINAYKISVAIDGRGARQTEVASTETTSRFGTSASPVIKMLEEYAVLDKGSHMKSFRDRFFSLDKKTQASAIRGLFTTDGTVANYSDKSQYISLDSTSIELLRQVQLILLGFGIKAKIYENRRAGKTSSLLPDGKGGMKEYSTKEIHSLRISRGGRILFEKEIGFMPESKKSKQLSEMNNEISTYSDSLIDK